MKLSEEILSYVGGKENIKNVEHCATRLRLFLNDYEIVDEEKIAGLEKVKGNFFSSGQYQIILGTGLVNKVYDEISNLCGFEKETKGDFKKDVYTGMNPWQKIARILGDVFIPLIPVLVTTGLFMGITGVLKSAGIMQSDTFFATFMSILTDAAFAFLPALVLWSAYKRFGGNEAMGIVLGLMFVMPALPNAWDVANGNAEAIVLTIGNFNLEIVGWQGQVLAPLAIGIFGAKLEQWIRSWMPEIIDLFVTPVIVFAICLFLGLMVFGPILMQAQLWVTNLVSAIIQIPYGIGAAFVAFINPIVVMTGIHHSYGAIEVTMLSQTGVNTLNPALSAANVAMGGAACGIAWKWRKLNPKSSSVAVTSAMSAMLGITEPAMFGVNLRYGRALLCSMTGGAIGAAVAGIAGIGAAGFGITGIFGATLYVSDGLGMYIISMTIAFVAAFILSAMFAVEPKISK